MTQQSPAPETPSTSTTAPRFAALTSANEWGQITDLEPHAAYFVVKRPGVADTAGAAAAKPKDYFVELKAFLHEHRTLAKKQLDEMKERYGDPRDRAKDVREKMEQKFDQVARQLEERYEKIENDLEQNLDRILGKKKVNGENGSVTPASGANGSATAAPETPGEMPRGDVPAQATQKEESSEASGAKKGAKKPNAKNE